MVNQLKTNKIYNITIYYKKSKKVSIENGILLEKSLKDSVNYLDFSETVPWFDWRRESKLLYFVFQTYF